MTINEACIGNNGKMIYGTAAAVHRLFGNPETKSCFTDDDREEARRMLVKLGYIAPDDESV